MYNVTAKCHTPLWLESGEICTSCRRDFKFTFEKSPSRETEAKRRCTSANFSAALTARRSNPWKSYVNPPAAFLRRTLILEKRATSVPAAIYQGYHTSHIRKLPFLYRSTIIALSLILVKDHIYTVCVNLFSHNASIGYNYNSLV